MKIQDIVRSMPWVTWVRGESKCYCDTSYTRTARKVRYKFVDIKTDLAKTSGQGYELHEAAVATALEEHGHTSVQVQVLDGHVCIWQAFPIQVTEQQVA